LIGRLSHRPEDKFSPGFALYHRSKFSPGFALYQRSKKLMIQHSKMEKGSPDYQTISVTGVTALQQAGLFTIRVFAQVLIVFQAVNPSIKIFIRNSLV
jgi:hypothetical protein